MERKGYLLADGRVVQFLNGRTAVAEVFYKETRYNLRRVFVVREWIVENGSTRGEGSTRRDAIADFLRRSAA